MAGEFVIQSGFLGSAELLAQGFQTGAIAEEEQSFLLLNTLPGFFEEAGLEQDLSQMVLGYRQALAFGQKKNVQKLGLAIAEAIRKQGQGLNKILLRLPREARLFKSLEKTKAGLQATLRRGKIPTHFALATASGGGFKSGSKKESAYNPGRIFSRWQNPSQRKKRVSISGQSGVELFEGGGDGGDTIYFKGAFG